MPLFAIVHLTGIQVQVSLVKFGEFVFDRQQGTIRCKEQSIHLEHQQAQILNLLIDNKSRIVSRDQIAEDVWQGVIVEDNTISKAITRLRKVLNDSAVAPQIIKTIPKKGYQFIAPLEEVISPNVTNPYGVGFFKHKLWWGGFSIVLLIITATLLVPKFKTDLQEKPVLNVSVFPPKPISFREGVELNAHLHPNEKTLIFVGNSSDGYALYSKNIGDAEARLLTPVSTQYVYPKWLGAQQMAFVYSDLNSEQHCQIYHGQVNQSASNAAHFSPVKAQVLATCLSDSPVEAFVNQNTNSVFWSDSAGSWQQNLSTGNRKSHLGHVKEAKFQMVSPTGKLWADLKDEAQGTVVSIYDITQDKRLIRKQLPYVISHVKWSKQGDALYHLGEHPASQLFRLSLTGEQALLATTSFGNMMRISDVQSDDTLEFVIRAVDLDIHQFKNGQESVLIDTTFADYNPALSPLSEHLAFASKRTGSAQIWVKQNQQSPKQISAFTRASYIYEIAWSPDERHILVKRNESIHLFNLISNTSKELAIDANGKVDWGWISNDTVSYVDNSTHSLFSIDIVVGNTELLKTDVGRAQLSQGRWFISNSAGDSLFSYSADFAEQALLREQLGGRRWFIASNDIFLVNDYPDAPVTLVKLDSQGGEQVVLTGRFNPLSIRGSQNGTLVFQRMNSNEANIYQLQLN